MDLIPLTTAKSTGDDIDPDEIVLTESAAELANIQTMVVSKGAYWLSNIEEIENPYFGDEMLKCGETKETIEYYENSVILS